MQIKLKQIRDSKNITEKDGFGVTVLYGLLGTGLFYLLTYLQISNFIGLIIVFLFVRFSRPFFRKYHSDWIKKEDVIGLLSFDHIFLSSSVNKNLIINYCDISSINLRYNYIKGNQFATLDIIHNGLAEIKIITNQKETKTFKFIIEEKEQLEKLTVIFQELYKKGIEIKESMGKYDVKTVLFDANYWKKQKP